MSSSIVKQIAGLHRQSVPELKQRWRDLVGTDPPQYSRSFLVSRLAHRLQELAYGGLSPSALDRATQLVTGTGHHLRDADILILEGRLLSKKGDKETGRSKLEAAIKEARREDKAGCVYQLAVGQATRCLKELDSPNSA